jgi:O-6-methylguanine DNA methyltransferase
MVFFSSQRPALILYGLIEAPFGPFLLGLNDEGVLYRASFVTRASLKKTVQSWAEKWPKTVFAEDQKRIEKQARAFFGSKADERTICLVGTAFQQKVWKALLSIPAGKTKNYADVARKIGNPKAVRAVGKALGANPVPFFVPCHRVIASDGTLGGFSGGLPVKKRLLEKEGVCFD